MDYILITILVFMASFMGNVLASSLNSGEKKTISSPIATITKKIEEKKEKKEMQDAIDRGREWLFASEEPPESEG